MCIRTCCAATVDDGGGGVYGIASTGTGSVRAHGKVVMLFCTALGGGGRRRSLMARLDIKSIKLD
jgi:hypothetical protein